MLSQEIETFYLIPAIRKSLVEYMIKKKIEKKKIAENLNLTKSAISLAFLGADLKFLILALICIFIH